MDSVTQLSNDQLLTNTRMVVRTERKIMNEVLAHLNEVFRRSLYVEIGYGDFLQYMIKDLGYTETCALQRIRAAKIVREVPKAAELLDKGDVNMSNLSLVQSAISRAERETGEKVSQEMKADLVTRIEKKTNAQAKEVLAEVFPNQKVVQEKITPIDKDLFRFTVVITRKQKEQLDRMKNLTSHSHFGASWAMLQEVAVREYLKRYDPLEKAARVQAKAEKVKTEKSKSCGEQPQSINSQSSTVQRNSISIDGPTARAAHSQSYDLSLFDVGSIVIDNAIRSPTRISTETVFRVSGKQHEVRRSQNISAPIRRAEMLRDHGRCTYRDPVTGRICGSFFKVQIDHRVPRALGGEDSVDNCRCLCQAHNLFEAERVFGKEHMNQYRTL